MVRRLQRQSLREPPPATHVHRRGRLFLLPTTDKENTSMRNSPLCQSRRTMQTPRQRSCNIGNLRPVFWIVALTVLTFSVMPVGGQTTTGTISGTVVDPTGALIPGAMVSVTNEATSDSRNTLTSETGNFSFPSLL